MEKFDYNKESIILQKTIPQFEDELEKFGIKTRIFATFIINKAGEPKIEFFSEPFDLNGIPALKYVFKKMRLVNGNCFYNKEEHFLKGGIHLEWEFFRSKGNMFQLTSITDNFEYMYWEYDLETHLWKIYTR